MLARPLKDIEVEFLPVYSPSPDEIADAALFAKNVQVLMAEGLDIPATEITYHEYYKEQCRKNGTDINDDDKKSKKG